MAKGELKFLNDSSALEIVRILRGAGHCAYYAGGAVRDALLGLKESDIDVASSAAAEQVEALFPKTIPIGKKFGIISVVMKEGEKPIEVARFREEKGVLDHRHPKQVSFSNALEDAKRRDFTINGMFYDPEKKEILDYVGGEKDLKKGIIRAIGDPDERFNEDYLRMLRAIRFSARLGFEIENETFNAIKKHAPKILKISMERIREELNGILISGRASFGIRLMDQSGLLEEILPEFTRLKGVEQGEKYHPEGDVYTHTLLALDMLEGKFSWDLKKKLNLDSKEISNDIFEKPVLETALGVFFHDISKPETFKKQNEKITFYNHQNLGAEKTKTIMKRMKYSASLTDTVSKIVKDHLKFYNVRDMKESTLRKFLSEEHFPHLLKVHLSDTLASSGYLEDYEFCVKKINQYSKDSGGLRPIPIYTGKDLIRWGIPKGPIFKEILDTLFESQLEGTLYDEETAKTVAHRIFKNKK